MDLASGITACTAVSSLPGSALSPATMVRMYLSAKRFLRPMLLPMAVSCPSAMIAMRSESTSASSMKCVESRIARCCLCADRSCQMSRREVASTPAVGSSSAMTREPPAKAMPMESLRFMPPLSAREGACLLGSKPVSRKSMSTSAFTWLLGTDLRLQKRSRCSSTVTPRRGRSAASTSPAASARRRSPCPPSSRSRGRRPRWEGRGR
mmetsp:Transcript_68688/g.212357  ORF Transcript_68688/g.212357 Transcript_68688/m.212357 type:complete len:208 (-) Transcript_68688:204-827(-)